MGSISLGGCLEKYKTWFLREPGLGLCVHGEGAFSRAKVLSWTGDENGKVG